MKKVFTVASEHNNIMTNFNSFDEAKEYLESNYIPTKDEYCKAKAKANTYEEIRHCIDPWTGDHCDIPLRHFATPEMFYQEYDELFNAKYLVAKLRKNIKKYNQIAYEIEILCNGFNRKTFPNIPKALNENLEEIHKINRLVEKELVIVERILRLAS